MQTLSCTHIESLTRKDNELVIFLIQHYNLRQDLQETIYFNTFQDPNCYRAMIQSKGRNKESVVPPSKTEYLQMKEEKRPVMLMMIMKTNKKEKSGARVYRLGKFLVASTEQLLA
jgi:hypothetical protein